MLVPNDQRNLGRKCLLDALGSYRGPVRCSARVLIAGPAPWTVVRHKDGRGRSSSLLDSIAHSGKDGPVKMRLAGLLRVGAANDICSYRSE